jgi:hypothetical protein
MNPELRRAILEEGIRLNKAPTSQRSAPGAHGRRFRRHQPGHLAELFRTIGEQNASVGQMADKLAIASPTPRRPALLRLEQRLQTMEAMLRVIAAAVVQGRSPSARLTLAPIATSDHQQSQYVSQ